MAIMNAEDIALALSARKHGASWMARCPAHPDRDPSLSIAEDKGKVLVRCHAGCAQREVIAALRKQGLWDDRTFARHRSAFLQRAAPPQRDMGHERTSIALSIWQASVAAAGTLVSTYLARRSLTVPQPASLRFHPALKHPSGGVWPCMVALVTRGSDDEPVAIHRTFLARDGSGKAPVEPAKLMLGPCRGSAVQLGEAGTHLMIGEGIETCLAALQATGRPAWAALSTSGLRSLELPPAIRDVTVLADGDDPGEAAARHCALRLMREGRTVRIARPPRGMDFNDVLQQRALSVETGQ